jgi:hypothetical protein
MKIKIIPNTLYVNYTKAPYANAVPDHEVEKFLLDEAQLCKNGQIKQCNVSTENVINAVRAMKLSGRIKCNVVIMFNSKDMKLQKDGGISNWPNGFCDYNDKWLIEIISFKFDKK